MTWPFQSGFWLTPIAYLKRALGLQVADDVSALDSDIDQLHPQLKGGTYFRSYGTSHATYSKIRVFYRPHTHADKLKAIADLPLLVFVHGLGGSLPQFAPLMCSLVNIAPTFAIELPGHGLSDFAPKNYQAYTFEALTELWRVAINEICESGNHHKVVLIGHSMGCSIGAALASANGSHQLIADIEALIAICPKSGPPSAAQVKQYRRLLRLPDFILNILRWFDRRGQESSISVKRIVGEAAGIDLKRLQLRFNKQFRTPVWKRTTIGLLPHYDRKGMAQGGMPGHSTWDMVKVPLMLIAGEGDTVTKPEEACEIANRAQGVKSQIPHHAQPLPLENDGVMSTDPLASDAQFGITPTTFEAKSRHESALKLVVLPAPASHALMYDHATYRTVAGLIEDFLAQHVSLELSLGWQLQRLTTSGKWDVKNLQKWKKVLPVSSPIAGGLFRALKTLREQDDEHSPTVFLQKWADKIFAVIDISHDSPIYDTKALERGGVQYHKFPTVSKVPPTLVEVQEFIALVDRLQEEVEAKYSRDTQRPAIAVHCHYGYNRTGFFIICYLIERRGYQIQDAIDEFAMAKPPGIKHDHFIDTLFVRYCVGLRRSSVFN